MVVIDQLSPDLQPGPPAVTEVDERAARRSLRAQIARLERQLSECVISAFPHTALDLAVPAPGGPRLLTLGELEQLRDDLAARVGEARGALAVHGERAAQGRDLLERMLENPKAYKWVKIRPADIGERGCAYHVRPRLGIIGMCMGWWHVKLSSGCPLATAGRRPLPGSRR